MYFGARVCVTVCLSSLHRIYHSLSFALTLHHSEVLYFSPLSLVVCSSARGVRTLTLCISLRCACRCADVIRPSELVKARKLLHSIDNTLPPLRRLQNPNPALEPIAEAIAYDFFLPYVPRCAVVTTFCSSLCQCCRCRNQIIPKLRSIAS